MRGWIALFAIAGAGLAIPRLWASGFATRRRAGLHLGRARAQLSRQDLPHARAEFRAALGLQPALAGARRELAGLELSAGNWEIAFLELQTQTELRPDDAQSWIGLAELMAKRGWLEAPEAVLDRAIDAAPQRADAHALRADLRFRLGRYHGARLDAEAALASATKDAGSEESARATLSLIALRTGAPGQREAAPAPAPPRRVRAEVQIDVGGLGAWTREGWPGRLGQVRQELESALQKKDWPAAERIVGSAERAFPDTVFGPYLSGILALAQDHAGEAVARLSEALPLAPRNPTVTAALAKAWAHQKGASFAGEQLMQLAERDPSFSVARYLAARAFVEARDPIHAEAALRRGLELQSDSAVPYQHLADYYMGLDRAPDAIGICQQGLDRFPGDPALPIMLAQIQASLGRVPDAARAYESVLAARPDLDIVAYRLAMLLASQDRDPSLWRRATELLRQLEADQPSDPLLADVLGWLHYRAGEDAKARRLLQSAIENAPDEPRPHFHLASLYLREQKRDLARTELTAALGSGRPFPERLEATRLLRERSAAGAPPRARAAPEGR